TRFSRDWSSDVCSSDLLVVELGMGHAGAMDLRLQHVEMHRRRPGSVARAQHALVTTVYQCLCVRSMARAARGQAGARAKKTLARSEERRVGKEGRRGRC